MKRFVIGLLALVAITAQPRPAFAQDSFPEDDADTQTEGRNDDAFIGQDAMFGSNNPFRLMYIGGYAGLAELTVKSYGMATAHFDTGFRFTPEWSAGIFASLLPKVQTLLTREQVALFGAEGHYHFDKWVDNFYMGVLVGFISVENTTDFGVGLKAAYDYQITKYFFLSSAIQMFINTDPNDAGHAFQALIGVKFQRGK